jgi:hypothetical protein
MTNGYRYKLIELVEKYCVSIKKFDVENLALKTGNSGPIRSKVKKNIFKSTYFVKLWIIKDYRFGTGRPGFKKNLQYHLH